MNVFERTCRATILGLLGLAFLSFAAHADLISDCDGKDDELALKACSELIRRNPNDATAFYNRGVAHEALGKDKEALEDYNRAIKINPRHPSFFHNRGGVHSSLDDLDSAIADYSMALRLDPNSQGTHRARAWARVRANKDLKEALADCARVIKDNPKAEFGYAIRSVVFYRLGQMKEAIADADSALKFDPETPDALYIRGLAKASTGDPDGAKNDIAAASKIDPEIAEYFAKYGIK
jgi:tetratricopeptide (TPR) repeat protein